jgi:hypothetical protein
MIRGGEVEFAVTSTADLPRGTLDDSSDMRNDKWRNGSAHVDHFGVKGNGTIETRRVAERRVLDASKSGSKLLGLRVCILASHI